MKFHCLIPCFFFISRQSRKVSHRPRAALSTTSWQISGKVSPSERPGPGAIRKASLLVKCIGIPALLVRTRDCGLHSQFLAPLEPFDCKPQPCCFMGHLTPLAILLCQLLCLAHFCVFSSIIKNIPTLKATLKYVYSPSILPTSPPQNQM